MKAVNDKEAVLSPQQKSSEGFWQELCIASGETFQECQHRTQFAAHLFT